MEDATKRLTVAVKANKDEYRPANAAKVDVDVKDKQGRGASSEVTLWAVDYGVLSLTAYRTPDILRSVYVEKALQVMNTDSRQRIVSRRVLTPKGGTDGGGGGADAGAGTIRKDFRVLAFWLGSVTTDAAGHATVDVKLPESLTTYRIMAVAADRASRFGSGDSEVRINKPITMKPTYPRFLAVGDTALFGAVITSQLKLPGTALVTMKSLDPAVLDLTAATEQSLPIAAGGSVEARFHGAGRAIGRARIRMTVSVGDETDAFEDIIPVEVLASPETVAAYGETTDAERDRHRGGDDSARRRARVRRPAHRAGLDRDGRARRRRPLSGRVSIRLRRAERLARARAAPGRRSGRRLHAAGHGHVEDAPGRAADAQGARNLPVPRAAGSRTGRDSAGRPLRTSPRTCSMSSRLPRI